MEEERLQILRLVEAGRISAEEAAELLRALQPAPAGAPVPGAAATTAGARSRRAREADELDYLDRDDHSGGGPYVLAAGGAAGAATGPQWLRIRVTDRRGRTTVDVQLPLSIVRVGLRIGARWVPQLRLLDPSFVLATLRLRAGKPVFTFQDGQEGDRVEITVE